MQIPKLETKRIFLIASDDSSLVDFCRVAIEKQISHPTIFTAVDGAEALFKVDNVLPHVAIVDARLTKLDGFEVTDRILELAGDHTVSVILVAEIPKEERYIDQIATRQVQFLPDFINESQLNECLSRALNRLSMEGNSTYSLRFLADQEILFHQGEEATHIFYVKSGKLEVTQKRDGGASVVVGYVEKDEFVGEMAHFSGEPRSATVKAVTECELIAIPCGALDIVLFSKPTWSKALIATLARRLKQTNARVSKS